jgi:8-oxo-dGTP pyrophosphatase MutT (NUDIX family)
VLVPLYERDGDTFAVFTRRREDLKRHAGEISFPGGRRDPGETLPHCALREAQEEIGLEPADVELVGALTPVNTWATGFVIHPFVGVLEAPPEWVLSEAEVAEVIELPLAGMREAGRMERMTRRGITFETHVYEIGDAFVWGATARVVADLLERVEI